LAARAAPRRIWEPEDQRAAVRHTCVSSRPGVRRVGHIDRLIELAGDAGQPRADQAVLGAGTPGYKPPLLAPCPRRGGRTHRLPGPRTQRRRAPPAPAPSPATGTGPTGSSTCQRSPAARPSAPRWGPAPRSARAERQACRSLSGAAGPGWARGRPRPPPTIGPRSWGAAPALASTTGRPALAGGPGARVPHPPDDPARPRAAHAARVSRRGRVNPWRSQSNSA
jgi:hypothetical protein